MKNILIVEDLIDEPMKGYDHVFSFRLNPADSFPDDYISAKEISAIYHSVYDGLSARLLDPAYDADFSDQGIKLLWCFKKELFDYAFTLALRYDVLKRVLRTFQGHEVFLSQPELNRGGVQMASVFKKSPLAQSVGFHLIHLHEEAVPGPVLSRKGRYGGWPEYFSLGNVSKREVAVFSDFERSKSVLKYLRRKSPVIFSNHASPRTLWRAWSRGAAYGQVVYRPEHADRFEKKVEGYVRKLKSAKIFSGYFFDDLDAEPWLREKLTGLFYTILPKVFGEAEGMRRFFKKARQLKSALLDEDVDPSKNVFCQIARQHGVQTFVELHGAIGGKHGLVPLTADKMFVWGKAQKKRLVDWGCPADKILVSGNSRYRQYQRIKTQTARHKVVKELGLDPDRQIGLLVFAPVSRWHLLYERKMRANITETLDAAAELCHEKHVQFVIKLHPADVGNPYYDEWIFKNECERDMTVVRKYDPMLLAKAVDFLVVYGSSYSVDGFALEKPVINIYEDSDPYPLLEEFKEYEVFWSADSKDELKDLLRKLIHKQLPKPKHWDEAREDCLNATGTDPEKYIASMLSHA